MSHEKLVDDACPSDLAFSKIVKRLCRQRDYGVQCSVFLESIVDRSERFKKFQGSFSGHVGYLQIIAVESCLKLFLCRVWDVGAKYQSIPEAVRCLKNEAKEVSNRLSERRREDCSSEAVAMSAAICKQAERLGKSPIYGQVRIVRSEELAHLLSFSRDRHKLSERHGEDILEGQTIRNLLDFAKDTLRLIERISYLDSGDGWRFKEKQALFEKWCDAYWDALPNFQEFE